MRPWKNATRRRLTLQEADDLMNERMLWGQPDSPERTVVELARGLDETWLFIDSRLQPLDL